MNEKLNKVVHDAKTGTIYISLRPRTYRKAEMSLEYPGRIVLDLDAEGDVYGIRLMGINPEEADKILKRLKAEQWKPTEWDRKEGGSEKS